MEDGQVANKYEDFAYIADGPLIDGNKPIKTPID
jgi:hypothetical protein